MDSCYKNKHWKPSEYSWVYSTHFVSGEKSDDSLSPYYVPSVFTYVRSPHKQKNEAAVRKIHTKKRNCKRKTAAETLIKMSGTESLLQDDASTESDSGDTGVATQTDPVSLADASTSTSTHRFKAAVHTDVTKPSQYLISYLESCQFKTHSTCLGVRK